MPLVGYVDPTHDERKLDEPGRKPAWFPLDETLARFATASPKFSPWTYELVQSVTDTHQERDYISTTTVVGGCMRSKVLERKEDFILNLDDLWAILRGTLVHRTLEFAARPNSLAEARFFTTIYVPGAGDQRVSCSPDLVTVNPTAVVDYKAPTEDRSIPQYGYPWKSQVEQLQFNRFIVNNAEDWKLPEGQELPWDPRSLVFQHLYIVYIGQKNPKVIECQKAVPYEFKNGNKGTRKEPDIWHDEAVLDMLVPRVYAFLKAMDAYPEWPEGLEELEGFEGPAGWRCPGKPWCKLPDCLAKRYPDGLMWDQPEPRKRVRVSAAP